MPFQIVRDDITKMRVDAIVNTANPYPVVGSGLDTGIHAAAGSQLLQARREIGNIQRGCAAITPGFQLPAKYVIHAVGPFWVDGDHDEPEVLGRTYAAALNCAAEAGCCSVALPLISTGNYGFPQPLALKIAIDQISSFLLEHDLQVYLVVFNKEAFRLTEKLFSGIASFIDDHYVSLKETQEYFPFAAMPCEAPRREMSMECVKTTGSLEELLKTEDAGFSETLLKLIDKGGYKDSEVYKRANLTKQHFSKIRNNPHYKPTKATAIALALALQLDLDQTKDLIGRAGYALTNSSKFDLIIRYFIESGNYNVVEINIALYEFDQPLLGA